MRKLSRPWHGPYRVLGVREPDVTVEKVYRPQDGAIQVHQTRVTPCPDEFPAGHYWYGDRRSSPGRPPRWVDRLLQNGGQEEGDSDPDPSDAEQPAQEAAATGTGDSEQPSPDIVVRGDTSVLRRPGLHQRVTPPDHWMGPSSGRARTGGRGDVANQS